MNILRSFIMGAALVTVAGSAAAATGWRQLQDFPGVGMTELISFSVGLDGYYALTNTQQMRKFSSIVETWSLSGSMPSIGFQSPSFVIGDNAYFVSGNNFWRYTPATNSWLQLGLVPEASWRAAVSFSIGSKGYVGGGFFNGLLFYEYDSVAGAWTRKADLPVSAIAATGFSLDGMGFFEGTNINSLYRYNPANDLWSSLSDVDAAYGRTFVAMGVPYAYNMRGNLYSFDLISGSWTLKTITPGTPTCYSGGFAIGYKIYVGVGGEFSDNTCTLVITSDFYEYDTRLVYSDYFDGEP